MLNIKKTLIPAPKSIEQGCKQYKLMEIGGILPKIIYNADIDVISEGAELIRAKLRDIAGAWDMVSAGDYTVEITIDPENSAFENTSAEAYFIKTTAEKAILCGKDNAGAFYAAVTFSQIIFEENDSAYVPDAYILDHPDFKSRGVYIESRYGTEFMTKKHWFDLVDYFASMKMNNIQVCIYNCWSYQYDAVKTQCLYVPIKKHPEVVTPKIKKYYSVANQKWINEENILPPMYTEDFFGELCAYAKKKNVTIVPLINSLGHNTLFPQYFPEISAVGEDGKPTLRGFCTRNEKTYEFMFNFYDEVIDRYLIPNGIDEIHVGLDEVGAPYICHCDKCKGAEHKELMVEYIINVCKHLKSRGMKTIDIFHDMLYNSFDIVNEELKERFIKEGIYDEVVLDWWTYEDPSKLFWSKAEGVNNIFRSVIKPATGYYHWAIPTENNENIRACAKLAKNLSFEGMQAYSSWELSFDKNYLTVADMAWNVSNADDMDEFDERYAYNLYPNNVPAAKEAFKAMSDIMKDETREAYLNRVVWRLESYFYCYRNWNDPSKTHNFPGEAYQRIVNNDEEYTAYLRYLKEKSAVAVDFFENSGVSSQMNDTWLLSAKHYYVLADEYQTLYGLHKSYNDGLSDEYQVVRELERLIVQREELMLLAEKTRLDVNQVTYLRGMSWFRQFMIDLLGYFKSEISAGRKPKLDMTDLSYATGKTLEFLK